MKLLVHSQTRKIHDASDVGAWDVPPAFEVHEVEGEVATYPWPNDSPTRCILEADNVTISGDPDWVPDTEWKHWLRGNPDLLAIAEWARSEVNEIRAAFGPPPLVPVSPVEMEQEIIAIRKQLEHGPPEATQQPESA